MRPGRRPLSPHVLPGVALVLIALSVLASVVLHPEIDRPWLSSPLPPTGPAPTPTPVTPPQIGAPADVLTEAAQTVRDAGAGHGPYAPGGYAERYAAGHLGQLAGGAGATYYIAITGTDTANTTCSLASPCASLTHFGVAQGGPTVLPGDTIDILPGQYNLAYTGGITPTSGTTGLWDWNGVAGTAAQPITIQGIGAVTITRETPASVWDQQVRLLSLRQQGGGAVTPNYVTFANLAFVGMTARADYIPSAMHTLDPGGTYDNTGGSEIEFYSSINGIGDIFDHLTVRDTANGCLKGGPWSTVRYSLLVHCGTGNIAHAVYAAFGNETLTHNVVQYGAGQSLYTDDVTPGAAMTITDNVVSQQAISIAVGNAGIQTSQGGSIVARNVVYDGYCGAIQIGHGLPNGIDAQHPITVEQNVLANWNASQQTNCGGVGYATAGYFTIRNNSFWGRGYSVTVVNGTPNGPMIVENNIFASGAGPNYACYIGYPTEDYNLFFNYALNPVCSLTQGAHDINGGASTDPLYWAAPYVPPASMNGAVPLPDLHLKAGSPARGVGLDVGYGTDLGAYPYDAGYVGTSTAGPAPTDTPTSTPTPPPPATNTPLPAATATATPTPTATPTVTITPTPLPTARPTTPGPGGPAPSTHTGHRR